MMNWFKRTKLEYLADLDWIADSAKKWFHILLETSDADEIKSKVTQLFDKPLDGYFARDELNWHIQRRPGSALHLVATNDFNPDHPLGKEGWWGTVSGLERYYGLLLSYAYVSKQIAVSASKMQVGPPLGPHAVRARDELAKRMGFYDQKATISGFRR